MPGDYSLPIKNARLAVVRDALNGGRIEILSDAGLRIASIEFGKPSGDVIAGSLIFAGFPKFGMAEIGGRASSARLVSAAGEVVRDGMTVSDKDADIVMGNLNIESSNVVKIDSAEIRA